MRRPALPFLPVTMVGSWPRPPSLLEAQKAKRAGESTDLAFQAEADEAVRGVLRMQEEAGIDLVTDGEQRRDSFFSFVAEKLSGVRLMTLAEMLDVIEDKTGFEQVLQTLDVPAYSISNATCVGRIARVLPLALDELEFVKGQTDRPVKVTLPGPYLLTRGMYVRETCARDYPTKEDLGEDVVQVLREELRDLLSAGAAFIQLDEPVLTEVVFGGGRARTFMCAALATGKDPSEELEFAVSLVNRVVDGIDFARTGTRVGVHVCRGNWSRNDSTLLRGGYRPLLPYLERMNVTQLVLEYATERAGDLVSFAGKEIGLGAVDPRTDRVEERCEVRRRIEEALTLYRGDRVFLNPDCGFATFSNRPVNTAETAERKLRALVDAARELRSDWDRPPSATPSAIT
jgi:5-methyltetrahydropteroyltriglutamate--homocysteine methyltransferase